MLKFSLMRKLFTKSWMRILSGLFTNLSAGALALVVIAPSFIPLDSFSKFLTLLYDAGIGIIFLVTAVKLDEEIK